VTHFRFYHPVEVRYGDLDPQGHVNNAKYLTYFEQARIAYIQHLGLWDGSDFMSIGVILADVHLTFRSPVRFGQKIQVGVCISHLGTKSLRMEYSLVDLLNGQEVAAGSSVQVTYDYNNQSTIPIPENWRQIISAFEDLSKTTTTENI